MIDGVASADKAEGFVILQVEQHGVDYNKMLCVMC